MFHIMQSENMNSKYAPLFQPYTLNNGITIDNRLVVAPMTHLASNPDGSLSDGERAFLQERVRGYGMFITAATLVSAEGKAFPGQPEAVGDKYPICESANTTKYSSTNTDSSPI